MPADLADHGMATNGRLQAHPERPRSRLEPALHEHLREAAHRTASVRLDVPRDRYVGRLSGCGGHAGADSVERATEGTARSALAGTAARLPADQH